MFSMQKTGKGTPAAASRKIHSIGGVMRGREIRGTFEADGQKYQFSYAPTSSAVANRRLELTGTFSISPARGRARPPRTGVRATLSSTQGGLGNPPSVRPELLGLTGQTSDAEAADQKDATPGEAKAPAAEAAPATTAGLPVTEATGPTGFVGVLYLRLSPLDGRALGVPLDLSSVQLNARLAPTSDLERDLQWLLSGTVAAVYGERPDERAASGYLGEINRRLKG
jgi:hypothetical protein